MKLRLWESDGKGNEVSRMEHDHLVSFMLIPDDEGIPTLYVRVGEPDPKYGAIPCQKEAP